MNLSSTAGREWHAPRPRTTILDRVRFTARGHCKQGHGISRSTFSSQPLPPTVTDFAEGGGNDEDECYAIDGVPTGCRSLGPFSSLSLRPLPDLRSGGSRILSTCCNRYHNRTSLSTAPKCPALRGKAETIRTSVEKVKALARFPLAMGFVHTVRTFP